MPPVDLPRGNAAKPPPRPAPPPRMLTTGANPRGVAIIQPAPRPTVNDVQARSLAAVAGPPVNLRTGANPRGVAIAAPSPKPTINDVRARALAATYARGDSPGPQGDYGAAAVNAYKQTPEYKQAVLEVFKAQSPHQQQAIIAGSLHNPQSPEAGMILNYARLSGLANVSGYGSQVQAAAIKPPSLAELMQSSGPITDYLGKLAVNAASDAAQMGPGTLEGLYSLGKQGVQAGGAAAQGQWGQALGHVENIGKSIGEPFIQAAEHPIKTFTAHPLNTLQLAYGLEGAVGRVAGAAGRAAGIESLSTARAPLHLGTVAGEPSPLTETRSFSRNAIHQAVQRTRDAYIRAKGQNPNIARPAPAGMPQPLRQAFNVGQEAKLNRISDEAAATRQTLGRVERGKVLSQADEALAGGKQVSREARKAAENVVTHALQRVIRTPETAPADAAQEIERLKNARTQSRSQNNVWNKRQARDLQRALNTPGALEHALAVADKLAPTIHGQDAVLESHAILTPEQLTAKYFPYAQAHMGAIYDPVSGHLVVPHVATATADDLRLAEQVLKSAKGSRAIAQAKADVETIRHDLEATHKELTTEEIQQHLEANGVPDPAYVGHYKDRSAPGQFYRRYQGSRGGIWKGKRTGEQFRLGGYDHTFEGLRGQLAARAEAVTSATMHDRFIDRVGTRKSPETVAAQIRDARAQAVRDLARNPAGRGRIMADLQKEVASLRTGYYNPAEAKAAAEAMATDNNGNPFPTEMRMEPMSAANAKTIGFAREFQDPTELHGLSQIEHNAILRAINDAQGRTDGTRNVVLVPGVARQRLLEQFKPRGDVERGLGKVTQKFRGAVLPYSTHWMAQIGTEAGLRAALNGVLSPHYAFTAKRLMENLMTDEKGRAVMAEATGHGGFYGHSGTMNIHYEPGSVGDVMQRTPGVRNVIAAHHAYAGLVGHAMTGLEHNFRLLGLGKLAHQEIQEFSKGWRGSIKLEGQVVDQLANRLRADPALVAKFGRSIDDMFGQYNKYTPKTRAAIQSVAPFLPWYLTATKYVFWQLPIHHPVASALLASLRQTVNQDVKDGKGQPLNAFAAQALGTMSPFGIFTPEGLKPADVLKEAASKGASAFLPQFSGPLLALGGDNPFFGRLVGPGGEVKGLSPQAISTAAESGIEGFLPLANKLRQGLEGGRPSYGTSAIWSPQPKPGTGPGDTAQILNRLLNPAYSFMRAKATQPSSGGTTTKAPGLKRFGGGGGGSAPGMKAFTG